MNNISYIIADDHAIFRQGIKFSLNNYERLHCKGEAASGDELLQVLQQGLPDVILMDLKMPGMDGVAATKEVRRLYPGIKIIVLPEPPASARARVFSGSHVLPASLRMYR